MGINEVVYMEDMANAINIKNVQLELEYILQKFGRDSELTKKTAEMFDAVVQLNEIQKKINN